MKTYRRPGLSIWPECWVPESFTGEWNNASFASSLLDRVVFGRAHPCFYSDRLVLERVSRSSVLCCHQRTFWYTGKSEAENIMKAGLQN
jgi:hypothetical protein